MEAFLDDIEVVLLDIDGTILDFTACVVETMQKGFELMGLPAYEPWMLDVFTEINEDLWRRLERREITHTELFAVRWNRVFRGLGMDADGPAMERFFRQTLMNSGIPVEGADQLLARIAPAYELGIASNGPFEQQRNRLNRAGFLDYFSYFFVSQKIGYSKPDPHFFAAVMAGINEGRLTAGKPAVEPGQVLMVGDSLTSDMDGGIQSGLRTCFYDPKGEGTKGRAVDLTVPTLGMLADRLCRGETAHA